MDPMLNAAVEAARRAGTIIREASRDRRGLVVRSKLHNDFVSEVDTSAEAAILRALREAYPGHEVLAEEGGLSGPGGPGREYQWVVDPLDGTTNFLHGLPQYAVSIALLHRRVLTQAVVYDPLKEELFTATRGAGAWLNGARISVSVERGLDECVIGTGIPFRNEASLDRYVAMLRDLSHKTAGIRRFGAAALDLAYVACGRFDGFWELDIRPWDMAAGALLVTEAGGRVADADGGPDYLDRGSIVAGSPSVFSYLLQLSQASSAR